MPTDALPPTPVMRDYYPSSASKRAFTRKIFDDTAHTYDQIETLMAFGTGRWYRRQALMRAGLARGMRVLDVAIGTGLVAREEIRLVGDAKLVTGLDPSRGMMSHAIAQLGVAGIQAIGEALPLADQQFDFVSMGYALRHLTDLRSAFAGFFRVLKPGGTVLVLEITRPQNPVHRALLKTYMKGIVPMLTRMGTGRADSQKLWEYYWETIDQCVNRQVVIAALVDAGFANVECVMSLGMFAEFRGVKR